jgi:uncharacterized membrane protein YdbT with pleckstrin-like domain
VAYDPEQDRRPIRNDRLRSLLMMIIRGLQIAFGVAAAVLVPPYGYVIAAVLIPYAVWMLIKEARKP